MGELHDRAVEELYETFDFLINDYSREVFWDEVHTELDYFEGQIDPRTVPEYSDRGKQVGEMDVVLVKEMEDEADWMKYFEVKPRRCGTTYAEDQTERAESFFGPRGWNVLTEVYRVPEWSDNWYDKQRDFTLEGIEQPEMDSSTKYDSGIEEADIDQYITDVERELRDELQEE